MAEEHDAGDDKIDPQTRAEEEREGKATHAADRPATSEEEAAADRNLPDADVAAHEHEMGKIGAEVKGEGEID